MRINRQRFAARICLCPGGGGARPQAWVLRLQPGVDAAQGFLA